MYPRLGFIAPYAELAEAAIQVCRDLGMEIAIEIGDLDEGVAVAKKMAENGVEVIISRGGTATVIANNVDVPVVEVAVSGFDLMRAVYQAKAQGSRIGVIGFQNIIYGTKSIEEMLGVYINELVIHSEREVPNALKEALSDGIEVIIGDVISVRWAQELKLGAILITSGKEAISMALNKAVEIAAIRRNERIRAEELRTILDYSYEGIIAIDHRGHVSVINHTAEKILGIDARCLYDKPAKEVLPALQMDEVLETGKSQLSKLCRIGNTLIVQNTVPVKANETVTEVIATFQDAKYFEEVESKVRQKLHLKGHVAQYGFRDIVTQSPVMHKVLQQALNYAAVDSTILITGETGSGKEILAQSIHNGSKRKNKPFVAVNCGAIPENLLESELFGYAEGAFTGAIKGGRKGFFELAHGGTLFLDEIGEISAKLQSQLLRVLQEKVIMRVGGDHVIPTDVRIIAATHRDLKWAVDEGRFRRDLYYRLNVLRLHLPPLRERTGDIPLLAQTLIRKISAGMGKPPIILDENVLMLFKQYAWEGNVRELENIIERLMILKSGLEVGEADIKELLPDVMLPVDLNAQHSRLAIELSGTLEEMERKIICQVLEDTNHDKERTCSLLGISNTTLWRRLTKWNISI